MSYWGLTVFSNILSTVPYIGFIICYWVWGSEFIQDYTLIKIHALHVFLPFILIFFIVFHLFFLHFYLSSDGFYDRFSFYWEKSFFFSFFFFRDFVMMLLTLMFFFWYSIIMWYLVFHEESFILVDTMKTSDKIIPEWFFLTFFGFIKAIPDKFGGVCVLLFFLINFFFLIFNIVNVNLTNINQYHLQFNILSHIQILYYIGFLSTNVTLLFPFIIELQCFVFFCILNFFYKII